MRLKDTTFNRIALATFVVVSVAVFSSQAFATTLPGAVLGSKITVGDTANTYAIADTNYLQGGHMQVANRVALCNITRERRSVGMLVTVLDDSTGASCGTGSGGTNVTYRLISNPTTDGSNGTSTPTTATNWRIVVPSASDGYNGGSNKYLTADSSGNFVWSTVSGGGGGSSSWGSITGTLSSQTDLQTALNAKQATLSAANGSTTGYLTSTDWNTFNNKLSSVAVSSPLFGSGTSGSPLTLSTASASTSGYLTSTDWNTFNNKLSGISIGSSITSATAGSLLFAGTSGVLAQNNSKLFWNNTDNDLGIGTSSPQATVHIVSSNHPFQQVIERTSGGTYNGANTGNARFMYGVDALNNPGIEIHRGRSNLNHGSTIYWDWAYSDDADNDFRFSMSDATNFHVDGGGAKNFLFDGTNVGIGVTSPGALFSVGSGPSSTFQVDGNGDLTKIRNIDYSWPIAQAGGVGYVLSNDGSGGLSWVSPGAASTSIGSSISSGISGSVLFVDSSSQLAQNNNNFFWDQSNNRLGIGTNTPSAPLHVTGNGGADFYAGILVTGGGNIVLAGNGGNTPTINLYPNVNDTSAYASNYYNGIDDAYYLQTVGLSSSDIVLRNFATNKSFRMDENGYLTIENISSINGVSYNWTSSQGNAGDVLINDGSGNLSWITPPLNIGASVANAPSNSMIFVDGASTLNYDSHFVWDNNNKRLGIGTFSPSSMLSVGNSNEFQVSSTGDIVSINNVAYSWPSSQALASGYVLKNNGSGNLSWEESISVGSPIGNNPTAGGIFFVNGSGQLDQQSNMLFFDQNNSRLGLGTNSPSDLLSVGSNSEFTVDSSGNLTTSGGVIFSGIGATNGSGDVVCIDTFTNALSRDNSGSCAVSSQRFKYDIVSLPYNALDTVNALRTVNFKYNGTNKLRTGFIAEEVEKVNKDYVVYEADGITPHGVYYIDMIPLIAKAVQEIDVKVKGVASLDLTNPMSVGLLIKQFLADQYNGIEILFAKVLNTDKVETKELCVGTTCITEAQFIEMVQNNSSSSSGSNNSVNNSNQNSDSNIDNTESSEPINNTDNSGSSSIPTPPQDGGEGASSGLVE